MRIARNNANVADLDPAVKHLRQMIDINPDLEEAKNAAATIANIQQAIAAYHRALQSN